MSFLGLQKHVFWVTWPNLDKDNDPSFGGFQILFSNFKSQESIFMVKKNKTNTSYLLTTGFLF